MARAIDGDELLGIERLLDTDIVRQSKTASWLLDQVLHDIQAMPTLTPPNEALTPEELREMGEQPYWHVGLRKESPPPHWNILDPFYAKHIEDYKYGENWLAYLCPPEGEVDA